jgi:hypothetical protein
MSMFQFSNISKIALIGAVMLGAGMPSVAEAGLKKRIKKILASPVGPVLTGSHLPLNWKKSLGQTKPVTMKNGQLCQTFHVDSAYRDSPSTKLMLPGYPKVVQSITGRVHIGGGLDVDTYNIVDSDVQYPATSTRPVAYNSAYAGAAGLSIPPLAHDKIHFGTMRPNYQEWSSKSEQDDIFMARKGQDVGDSRSAVNYLTMVLELRNWKTENSAPLPASGPYAATAIVEICVA